MKKLKQTYILHPQPLISRLYGILKRLGAEKEFLNEILTQQTITKPFIKRVVDKIDSLGGMCHDLAFIGAVTADTDPISSKDLFDFLDPWIVWWDQEGWRRKGQSPEKLYATVDNSTS